jgi:hypothetical protein
MQCILFLLHTIKTFFAGSFGLVTVLLLVVDLRSMQRHVAGRNLACFRKEPFGGCLFSQPLNKLICVGI